MITDSEKQPAKRPVRPAIFLVMMFFYLLLVHVWILWQGPDNDVTFPGRVHGDIHRICLLEQSVLGTWWAGYRLVNMALLYGCMVAVFFFVRHALRSPWWLGSLVAVMFMAHPLKGEALLETAGIRYLVPALLAFSVLALYAANSDVPRRWKYITALLLAVPTVLLFPVNRFLPLVLMLFEVIALPSRLRNPLRSLPFLLLIPLVFYRLIPSMLQPVTHHAPGSLSPVGMWLPLYAVPWPVPLSYETVRNITAHPAVLTAGITGTLVLLVLLYLMIRHGGFDEHRAFAFGILAALAIRLCQGSIHIDPVRFNGGGTMMVPIVLLLLSFAALCMRMMRHPAWRAPVVFITTLLCAVLFLLQIEDWMNMQLYFHLQIQDIFL